MKLMCKCVGCKQDIQVKSSAKTRPDLEYELGEAISVTCTNCNRKQTKHPNEVRAVENQLIGFIGLLIGLALTIILYFFLGLVGSVVMAVPMYLFVAESQKVLTFNKYRL